MEGVDIAAVLQVGIQLSQSVLTAIEDDDLSAFRGCRSQRLPFMQVIKNEDHLLLESRFTQRRAIVVRVVSHWQFPSKWARAMPGKAWSPWVLAFPGAVAYGNTCHKSASWWGSARHIPVHVRIRHLCRVNGKLQSPMPDALVDMDS
ncbi:hypothetical protein MA05_11315 [Comamonas aquatica]|nr:hypothetical protein MA05_11315 [Comamonas aquatica]